MALKRSEALAKPKVGGEYKVPKPKVKGVALKGKGKGVPKVGGGLGKALSSLHARFPKV